MTGLAGARPSIVAWRSPYELTVRIAGAVEVDAACGDGIRFWLDRAGETLETFDLPTGMRAFDRVLAVGVGETIYVGVEPGPGNNDDCDQTWLRLTIPGG